MAYAINVYDPENDVVVVPHGELISASQVREFLIFYTDAHVNNQLSFLRLLEHDGIAEHVSKRDQNHHYDITAMKL